MSQRILIAHASRAGSTAEVAEFMANIIREAGAAGAVEVEAEVRPVRDVQVLAGYDSVVLGTAIWFRTPLPEALRFVTRHQHALATRPVAYFALCDLLAVDTPANRARARAYVMSLVRLRYPLSVGLFGGARDLSRRQPVLRWLLRRIVRAPEGDWRRWGDIRAWTAAVAPRLIGLEPALPDPDWPAPPPA